jgi:sterol desaturase/sphingolipid hydroxylase (fatty acid hydroxylase superfamily)
MEKLAGLVPPVIAVVFLILERLWPARPLPAVRHWSWKGLLFFALAGVLMTCLPPTWAGWARAHRLLDLEALGTWWGAIAGIVATDLIGYWFHRLRHAVTPLWRLHQMHHSAERLDVAGAFYFHPLEVVLFALVSTCLARVVVGVSAPAAALVGLFGFFASVFTHANLRTPRWLGYVLQRPEAHAVHHQRGLHAFNYGVLALWDAVFGTYRNPTTFAGELGFWDGASAQVAPMLAGLDVTYHRAMAAGERSGVGVVSRV